MKQKITIDARNVVDDEEFFGLESMLASELPELETANLLDVAIGYEEHFDKMLMRERAARTSGGFDYNDWIKN